MSAFSQYFRLDRDAYRERMFLKGLLLLFTAWFIGTFLWVSIHRIGYPYELESSEGAVAEGAARILDNHPFYSTPSLEWVPFTQTPLYFYLGAGMMKILGLSIPALRFLTLLASIATGVILFYFLNRTGVEEIFALTGFGLYFAAYSDAGSWYDFARPDSLAIFFAISAIYFSAFEKKGIYPILSAILIVLSFFTRQAFLFVWVVLMVHWYFRGKKAFVLFSGISILLFALGFIYLNYASSGLFFKFIFSLPLQGSFVFSRLISFWFLDILYKFPFITVPSALSIFGLGRLIFRKKVKSSDSAMAVMVIGFIGVALMIRLQTNECENALIPASIVLTGLTAWVLQHFHLNEYGLGWLLPVIFKILVIMHFAFSLYNPFPRIPSSADLQAGKLLIKKISALPGEVFIPNHNFYARMAGKRTYVSYLNLEPFLYVKNESARSTLPLEIKESLANCKFSAIILDEPWDFWKNVIEQHYQFSSRIFDDPEVFRFKAGRNSRPQFIFIPRETELK